MSKSCNPLDTEALQVLADICFSVEEPTIAIPAFANFFEHSVDQGLPDDVEMVWKLLDIYMELLVHCSRWAEALLMDGLRLLPLSKFSSLALDETNVVDSFTPIKFSSTLA